jgi:integrase/recombinase XerC
VFVGESHTRLRVAAKVPAGRAGAAGSGLADVLTMQRRRSATTAPADERSFYIDTLAEYQWARDAAGLMPGTIDQLVKPVIELCEYYDTVPWRLQPKQLDRYPGRRGGVGPGLASTRNT